MVVERKDDRNQEKGRRIQKESRIYINNWERFCCPIFKVKLRNLEPLHMVCRLIGPGEMFCS